MSTTLNERVAAARLSRRGSELFDLLRALAALAVMVSHLRELFFVDHSAVVATNPVVDVGYLVTGLGGQAVIAFFVLSGYFISATSLRRFANGRWSWRWYATRRLSRLWVVLLPALTIGALTDVAGLTVFGHHGVYRPDHVYQFIVPYSVESHLTAPTAAGNVFFLQALRVPELGSNGALWSLAYEFWFYVMFPLLLFAISARRGLSSRIAAVVGLMLVVILMGVTPASYFLIWLLGAAVFVAPPIQLLHDRPRLRIAMIGAAGGTSLGAAILVRHRFAGTEGGDVALAVVFALLMLTIAQLNPSLDESAGELARSSRFGNTAKFFASFSFSLYVIHVPILVLVREVLDDRGIARWQPTTPHILAGAAIGVALIAYAWTFSRLTERNTDRVRKRISAWMGEGSSGAPTASL